MSKTSKVLKPIDKVSLGEITSHRAVTTVNAKAASKSKIRGPSPLPEGEGRNGVPKSDRCGIATSAG